MPPPRFTFAWFPFRRKSVLWISMHPYDWKRLSRLLNHTINEANTKCVKRIKERVYQFNWLSFKFEHITYCRYIECFMHSIWRECVVSFETTSVPLESTHTHTRIPVHSEQQVWNHEKDLPYTQMAVSFFCLQSHRNATYSEITNKLLLIKE